MQSMSQLRWQCCKGCTVVPQGSGLLSELPQEQQLQAAILADMWQVPSVGEAVADMLSAVADGQLSEAVTERLLSMQAVPSCLEPLLKKVLLSVFGDLEAVWADAALQLQLLGLPLHALKLLLSCTELKVASEDTVMFTIRRYVKDNWASPAALQLRPVVRCPHLSMYWLAAVAAPTGTNFEVFPKLLPKLTTLHMARIINPRYQMTTEDHTRLFSDAPAAWALPKRASAPLSSVQMTWELPVEQLREAAQRSVARNAIVALRSPCCTPPLSGIQYDLHIKCSPNEGSGGIGLYVGAVALAASLWMPVDYTIAVPGVCLRTQLTQNEGGRLLKSSSNCGWRNFFKVSPMAGGWDEEAWAAQGLPTSGTLTIKLTVSL